MAGFAKVEEMAVWRHARAFVSEVYAVTRSAPFCRDFGLRDQIQRATVSIGEEQFIALFTHSKQISGMIYNLIDSIKVSEK